MTPPGGCLRPDSFRRGATVQDFEGKVAVITGAASGIGRALAERFNGLGMRLVLSDVESEALERVRGELAADGAQVIAVRTDVSQADQVSDLAERTLEAFGAVHVVCNNAGVFAGGLTWTQPLSDYEWVFGVNVWGVIHGIRTFVPILLEQGQGGHIVNTASMAGLTNAPLSGAYTLSKHAVVAISETLHLELQGREPRIGVSVLCPELIKTGIGRSDRNRPAHLKRVEGDGGTPERDLVEGALASAVAHGVDPMVMAERVEHGIRDDRFYLLPGADDPWRKACDSRLEDIRLGRNPTFATPDQTEG